VARDTPAAIETTRWSGVTAWRISPSSAGMLCGLTARTSTLLRSTTARFESETPTPVSASRAALAASTGSLAETHSGRAEPARSIPRIRAVAIFPEPRNPQRG
jgi:hypothetical protein